MRMDNIYLYRFERNLYLESRLFLFLYLLQIQFLLLLFQFMQFMQRISPYILLLILLFHHASSSEIHFIAERICTQQGFNLCQKWDTTVTFNFSFTQIYMCFPAQTKVMTHLGPKLITHLHIGDQILAYNFQKGHNVYSPVTAWLHRDTESRADFINIITHDGGVYRASPGHNIAFNKNGTIGFKYAENLAPGDQLIGNSGQSIVKNSNDLTLDIGLFSPVTQLKNFYIFPIESDSKDSKDQMILVHCLASISDPFKKQGLLQILLSLSGWFGLNEHKNLVHQAYLHPITFFLGLFRQSKQRKKKISLSLSLRQEGEGDSNIFVKHMDSVADLILGQSFRYGVNQLKINEKKLSHLLNCLIQMNSIIYE